MTLIFIVFEPNESFPSPVLCWCLNTLIFLLTRPFVEIPSVVSWIPIPMNIASGDQNLSFPSKNDLSVWQCIIRPKFIWIGRLLHFPTEIGKFSQILLDVSDNFSFCQNLHQIDCEISSCKIKSEDGVLKWESITGDDYNSPFPYSMIKLVVLVVQQWIVVEWRW